MDPKLIKIVKEYIAELKKRRIHILRVYLYGSYAKKVNKTNSDIDVAVISDSFSDDWFENMKLLLKLRRKVDLRIEPIPFRPEDFNPSQPLYHQITREGIQII